MKKFQLLLIAGVVSIFSACKEEILIKDSLFPSKPKPSGSPATQPLTSWMSSISDEASIATLSIPGTHDSGALKETISGTAKSQNLSIAEQLNAGVRYLDIRCRHINNRFAIHHGVVYQNLNFDDVLNACFNFLNSHPKEAIIMSLKEEYIPSNNTRTFAQTFDAYVKQNASKWSLSNNVPLLGSIRGQIKLVRRFAAASPKGIDATAWADNATFEINNGAANLKVQDYYHVSDVNTKWQKIETLLNEAKNDSSGKLYLNYCSGYKSYFFGIPSITTVSNAINPKVTTFFSNNTHGRFGIIPLDFIDANRSQLIVNTNF